MSSQFTYEIDEKNIRAQLKKHSIQPTEEDWNKFNDTQLQNTDFKSQQKINQVLNFTLNRRILMPVAFGIFILIFALLLANFMSIKNSNPTEVNSSAIPATPPKPNTSTVTVAVAPADTPPIVAEKPSPEVITVEEPELIDATLVQKPSKPKNQNALKIKNGPSTKKSDSIKQSEALIFLPNITTATKVNETAAEPEKLNTPLPLESPEANPKPELNPASNPEGSVSEEKP